MDEGDGPREGPEAIDRLVDDVLAGRPGADDSALRDVADRLRALAREPLPPATRERHLERLRPAPAVHPRPVVARPHRGRVRRRLAPVLAAVVAMLLAGGGTVAVAQDAVPDDALYGVKRASEGVWVAMPRGSQQAAQVQLTLAMRRHGEALRAPEHAERLLAAGAENAEEAADELPEEAFETFKRLLGDGEDAHPAHASPRAKMALHRNCERLAERHGFNRSDCGDAPTDDHPGRRGFDRAGKDGPRGFGPDGRPEGETGPPDWARSHDRGEKGERGFGPEGRPEGETGPPDWAPGHERGGRPDHAGADDDTDEEPEDGS
jgi:hypothetical protein